MPVDEVTTILDQLHQEGGHIDRMRRYYRGEHPGMAFSTARFKEAFGRQLAGLVSNYMDLVCDTISARIQLQGFRFSGQSDPDQAVWSLIWQGNSMDADSALAHTDALVVGRCPLMVWPTEDGLPRITIEDAKNCSVRYVPGDRKRRKDAVKRWVDEDNFGRLSWFTPEDVKLYRTQQAQEPSSPDLSSNATWELFDAVPNPFGAVPLVELRPRPTIEGGYLSELADLIPTQDAINKTWSDLMVASEYTAFQQRWATGIDVPRDDNGQPLQPFSELARLWVSEDENARFGALPQGDLGTFTNTIRAMVDHLSSQAAIPGHLLAPVGGQYPSGEALQAAEAPLVDKCRRYEVLFGEQIEELVRMGLRLVDDPRSLDASMEVIWKDPAQHSIGALIDGLIKLQSLGVPDEALWRIYGASPQEVESWRVMKPSQPQPPVPAQP